MEGGLFTAKLQCASIKNESLVRRRIHTRSASFIKQAAGKLQPCQSTDRAHSTQHITLRYYITPREDSRDLPHTSAGVRL